MSVIFTKMCGAGNDFLITDYTRLSYKDESIPYNDQNIFSEKKEIDFQSKKSSFKINEIEDTINNLVKKIPRLCDRRFGPGADGICFLTPSKEAHLNWQFFNKDGSSAEMCGNAACCIIYYVYKKKLIPSTTTPFTFAIQNKILSGEMDKNNKAKLSGPIPKILQRKALATINGQQIQYDKVNSGVIHILIESNNVKNFEKLRALAQTLRQSNLNSNITFYKKETNKIECITFERGVEDFTLACGTGALAAAHLLHEKKNTPIPVEMRGGTLEVSFSENQAYLISPVHFIAEMFIYDYKQL